MHCLRRLFMDKIDTASMMLHLTTFDEAVEILTDMFNGDYTLDNFKNDVRSSFEPDDRGDINR